MRRWFRRATAVAQKEMIHIIRDTRVLYLALLLPVVMLFIFGYAVSLDIDNIPIAIVDQDATEASRSLSESMVAGGVFVLKEKPETADDAETLMRQGVVKAALILPRGYQRRIARHEPTGAQLLVDGTDSTVATLAMSDAAGILQSRSAALLTKLVPHHFTPTAGLPIRSRFNPGMRSSYVVVPGVIALILAMVSTLLTALAVAREWERGSMEQLFATPVGRSEIIVGKVLPYAGIGIVQTLLILTLGSILFDVPIVGSIFTLFGYSTLFLLAMLGIGLFISVVTKSQFVSVQMGFIVSMLPSLLLSGFLFPISNMPWWLQAISRGVPARYYVTALRGVLLKGNGVAELQPELLGLSLFAVATLTMAVTRFQRTL